MTDGQDRRCGGVRCFSSTWPERGVHCPSALEMPPAGWDWRPAELVRRARPTPTGGTVVDRCRWNRCGRSCGARQRRQPCRGAAGAAHAPHQACHHVRRVAPPCGACWPYRAGRVRHACPEGSRTRDPYTDTATAVACRRSPLAHRLRLRRGEACLAQGNTPHPRLAPLGTPSPASRGREGRGVREAPPPAARVGGHDGSVASCPGPDGPGGSGTPDPYRDGGGR